MHLGDKVLAEGRPGHCDSIGGVTKNANMNPEYMETSWRVFFDDGQQPLMKTYTLETIHLIQVTYCPHQVNDGPRFIPERGIMG